MPCLVSLMALSVQLLCAVFPQPPPDIPQSFVDLSKGAGRVSSRWHHWNLWPGGSLTRYCTPAKLRRSCGMCANV